MQDAQPGLKFALAGTPDRKLSIWLFRKVTNSRCAALLVQEVTVLAILSTDFSRHAVAGWLNYDPGGLLVRVADKFRRRYCPVPWILSWRSSMLLW
jgi:hypothetical protein